MQKKKQKKNLPKVKSKVKAAKEYEGAGLHGCDSEPMELCSACIHADECYPSRKGLTLRQFIQQALALGFHLDDEIIIADFSRPEGGASILNCLDVCQNGMAVQINAK